MTHGYRATTSKRTFVVSIALLCPVCGISWSKTDFTRTPHWTDPRKRGRPKQLISPIKNYGCDDCIFEFDNDHIFVFATEVIEKTTIELDDVLEENYMTVYVKTINGKTISIKCDKKQKAATISDEVERISSICEA